MYSGNQGISTSGTVSDLPDGGSTVYVRIWSSVSGYWFYNDYTYTASNPKGDLNGDNIVNLTDAILALQVINGLHPALLRSDYVVSGTDVNGDNQVGMEELIYILQDEAELR